LEARRKNDRRIGDLTLKHQGGDRSALRPKIPPAVQRQSKATNAGDVASSPVSSCSRAGTRQEMLVEARHVAVEDQQRARASRDGHPPVHGGLVWETRAKNERSESVQGS